MVTAGPLASQSLQPIGAASDWISSHAYSLALSYIFDSSLPVARHRVSEVVEIDRRVEDDILLVLKVLKLGSAHLRSLLIFNKFIIPIHEVSVALDEPRCLVWSAMEAAMRMKITTKRKRKGDCQTWVFRLGHNSYPCG